MHCNPQRILFRASMIADGTGIQAAPGAVLLERTQTADQIIASGSPQEIGTLGEGANVVDLPRSVIIPALVNAHAHLDLTHIGPVPAEPDFTRWVDLVRAKRATIDADIDDAVRLGVEFSRKGGTAFIGDIAGAFSHQPIRTLRDCGMAGVSFLEVFGLGRHQPYAIARMTEAFEQLPHNERGVRLGFQPHAPYSCGIDVFRAATTFGLPLSTHLSETLQEIEFVQAGSGLIAEMLRRIGTWDESLVSDDGLHPIDHVEPVLSRTPFVAAHLNYLDDSHLEKLARWPITVVYCPRASAYFGHGTRLENKSPTSSPKSQATSSRKPHRYREMLERGINVALGTDSILCLDTPDRISVLDEMRFLYQRDGTDAITLLRMATINGANALGIDPSLVDLRPGSVAGLLAIESNATDHDSLRGAMMSDLQPSFVLFTQISKSVKSARIGS